MNQPSQLFRGSIGASTVAGMLIAGGLVAGLISPSAERGTSIGPLPVDPDAEARVSGNVWLAIALSVVAIAAGLLWWYRGPRRGPSAVIGLAIVVVVGAAIASGGYYLVTEIRGGAPQLADGQDGSLLFMVDVIPALATPTFVAVLCYTVLSIGTSNDDLDRRTDRPGVTHVDDRPVVGLSGVHDPAAGP